MSGRTNPGYTLNELADALGVDALEAAELLDEHGYRAPEGGELLTLTPDEYADLMEASPLGPDGDER